jgi:hypothetical protein
MLDELFDIYKKNFILLAGITGIIYLPATMLYNYATIVLKTKYTFTHGSPNVDLSGLVTYLILTFVLAIVYYSMTFIVTAAITWAISKIYLGDQVTILQSYKIVVKKIVPFALTMILASLLRLAGFMMLCLPVIVALLVTAFVSEVFIIEGKQYADALKRSFELVKGDWVKVLVVGLIVTILTSIVSAALVSPFIYIQIFSKTQLSESMALLQGFCQGVAQTLAMPVEVIAFVLLYYDIRIRKEGFDIEMLAAGMDDPTLSE